MIQLPEQFKEDVFAGLMQQRENFSGTDAAFAKQYGIATSIFSRLKTGERGQLINQSQWLNIGRQIGVTLTEKKLKVTRTDVLSIIEEDVTFCQAHSKARIFVDDSEIGKTVAARYLARTLKNCFYLDASQAKTKQLLIRLIARTIGIASDGKYADVKANIKYYLRMLPTPMIIIDEAGDLEYKAFLELKEFWNATENACGWYLIGDDSLEHLITQAIRSKKPGFRALFSRFSSSYTSVTPTGHHDKVLFYRKLITDVLTANIEDKSKINEIVKKCLRHEENGHIGGLRRAESLLILHA